MLAARLVHSGESWQQYHLVSGSSVASYREVLTAWISDATMQDWFSGWLARSEYDAFFLEVRPVVKETLDEDFEFVVANSSTLARSLATPETFKEWYKPREAVVSFPNLGSDATLIAPCPDPQLTAINYAHLASFLRTATSNQIRSLWHEVGLCVSARVDESPLWVSTSGMGVAWLHVRLDRTPKYYTHAPYRLL